MSEPSAMYDDDVSAVYDFFYRGRGQDFAADAETLAGIVTARKAGARSLLDVACGTGEHLRSLATHFPELAGLELSAPMCAVARAKLPDADIVKGDMRDFRLGRRFDAITCLTSSLGYMADDTELKAACATMAGHLEPGGVLIVDPWWTPESFLDGHIADDTVRDGDRVVMRLSHSTRTGTSVRHEAHYLAADPGGIRHFTHVQPLTLFTEAQYLAAIADAGCVVEKLEPGGGFAARGLYVGVRNP